MTVAIITGGGVEGRDKTTVKAYMKKHPETGELSMVAFCEYRGQHIQVEVPILPGDNGNVAAMHEAHTAILKKARAVQLTDVMTLERIR